VVKIFATNPQLAACVVFCGKVVAKNEEMWEIVGIYDFI
jgi:hypothetical protein